MAMGSTREGRDGVHGRRGIRACPQREEQSRLRESVVIFGGARTAMRK